MSLSSRCAIDSKRCTMSLASCIKKTIFLVMIKKRLPLHTFKWIFDVNFRKTNWLELNYEDKIGLSQVGKVTGSNDF